MAQYIIAETYSSKLYSNAVNMQTNDFLNHINLDSKTNKMVDIPELLNILAGETIRQASGTTGTQPEEHRAEFEKWFSDDFGKLVKLDPEKAREQLMTMSVEFVNMYSAIGDFAKTTKCFGKAVRETHTNITVGRWSAFCLGLIQAAFSAIMIYDWKQLNLTEKIEAISSLVYGLFSSGHFLFRIADIRILISQEPRDEATIAQSRWRVTQDSLIGKDGEPIGFNAADSIRYITDGTGSGTFEYVMPLPREGGLVPPTIISVDSAQEVRRPDSGDADTSPGGGWDQIPTANRPSRTAFPEAKESSPISSESLKSAMQHIFNAADTAFRSCNVLILGLFAATQIMVLTNEIKNRNSDDQIAEIFYYTQEAIVAVSLTGATIMEGIVFVGSMVDNTILWLSKVMIAGSVFSVLAMVFQTGAMIAHSFYSDPLKLFAQNTLAKYVQNLSEPPKDWKPAQVGTT